MYEKLVERISLAFYFMLTLLATALCVVILRALEIEDPAAWVQAVGSIGAIGAAIWIMNRQNERAREDRKEQRQFDASRQANILKAIFSTIAVFSSFVEKAFDKSAEITNINGSDDDRFAVSEINLTAFAEVKEALEQVQLWEFSNAELVTNYRFVLGNLKRFLEAVESARKSIDSYYDAIGDNRYNPDYETAMDSAVNNARNVFFDLRDSVSAAIQRCNDLILTD